MSRDNRLLRSLRLQGQICAGLGSPMYGDVLDRVAADVDAGGVFAAILSGHENDSGRLAVPLRLLGIGLPLTIAIGALLAAAMFAHLNAGEAVVLAVLLAPRTRRSDKRW